MKCHSINSKDTSIGEAFEAKVAEEARGCWSFDGATSGNHSVRRTKPTMIDRKDMSMMMKENFAVTLATRYVAGEAT